MHRWIDTFRLFSSRTKIDPILSNMPFILSYWFVCVCECFSLLSTLAVLAIGNRHVVVHCQFCYCFALSSQHSFEQKITFFSGRAFYMFCPISFFFFFIFFHCDNLDQTHKIVSLYWWKQLTHIKEIERWCRSEMMPVKRTWYGWEELRGMREKKYK